MKKNMACDQSREEKKNYKICLLKQYNLYLDESQIVT